jgi:hypothetical protein
MTMGKIEDFLKALFPTIFNETKQIKYLSGKKVKSKYTLVELEVGIHEKTKLPCLSRLHG